MATSIADIIRAVEAFAPPAIQEDWDNTGGQVGSTEPACTGVTLCVDCTPEVIDSAVAAGHNLVISHHPVIFKPLRRLTGQTLAEATLLNAIAAGVTIYSTHTALDSTTGGISAYMAEQLGLVDVEVLEPRSADWLKLTLYTPTATVDALRQALFAAGAGQTYSHYDCCSFGSEGNATFRALAGANPACGEIMELHAEPETRLEMLIPRWRQRAIIDALRRAHPYEQPAYELTEVITGSQPYGLGCVGTLPSPLTARELALLAKETFGCQAVRVPSAQLAIAEAEAPRLSRVALCGGAGGSLIKAALGARAQAMVTADLRYHDFVDFGSRICLVDIGHFEGEKCARQILYKAITEKFPNFAVAIAPGERNPAEYL